MTILVTGAGGTVGSELVKQLKAGKAKFRAAYHSPEKMKRARAEGIDAVAIDYAKPESVAAALQGVECLFLLHGGGPDQVTQEAAAAKTAKTKGLRRIVKLSVWAAAAEEFEFAKVHRAVEREIESLGIDYTFVRPGSFMQNLANFDAPTIKTQGAFYHPAGDARISHIDVRDIAAVAARALTEDSHARKVYELSGPEALSYHEVAQKISAAAGRTVKYVAISDDDFRKGAHQAGIPDAYIEMLIDLSHYYIAGKANRVTPTVKQVLGRDPIAFDRFARDHAAAFK